MIQSSEQFSSDLGGIIREQQSLARGLLETLEAERQALDTGNLEAMETTAADKVAALASLEGLKARETGLLDQLPFGKTESPMQQALTWCDTDGALQREREQAIALMRQCEEHNSRNGLMVQYRLNYVRRAIDVLHQAHADTFVYGRDGSTGESRPSRLLAEG